jgi:hypothetical protein
LRGKIQRPNPELGGGRKTKGTDWRQSPITIPVARMIKNDFTNIEPGAYSLTRRSENFSDLLINLSSVGNLKKSIPEKERKHIRLQDDTRVLIKVKKLISGKAKLFIDQSGKRANRTDNLKKGGREVLQRTNLTDYAKSKIRDAGNVMGYLVENDSRYISSLMATLTYGKAVPDHKTAKRHLNLFLTRCRQYGWLNSYVWVAQNQTGKRATEKGLSSYRATNGSAIHFHILFLTERGSDLQLKNAQRVLRAIWKEIVNKWEVKKGFPVQNIGGVDIRAVYNSSNYISRYISQEEGTIIGNLWGMSSQLRKHIEPEEQYILYPKSIFNKTAYRTRAERIYRKNVLGETEVIGQLPKQTISIKLWNGERCICTNEYSLVKADLDRESRNYGYDVPTTWTKEDKFKDEQWKEIQKEVVRYAERNFKNGKPDKGFARRDAVRKAIETLQGTNERRNEQANERRNEQANERRNEQMELIIPNQ